jgi:LPXTG-motif cell wall-anchored protein
VALAKLATVVALLSLLAPALAQGAESSTSNYETKLDAIRPPVEGLDVTTEGGDRYLVVENDTGKLVSVAGYDNEPYLRFLPNGQVQANASSPARYLNEIRFGTPENVTIPRGALATTKVKWEKVGDGGSYRWFDHRIHWMEKEPPPVVKDESKRTTIFQWKVPAKVGATPVTLAGTLFWVPAGSSSSSGLSAGAIAAIVAGALVLLAALALLLRRRRKEDGADPHAENVGDAW